MFDHIKEPIVTDAEVDASIKTCQGSKWHQLKVWVKRKLGRMPQPKHKTYTIKSGDGEFRYTVMADNSPKKDTSKMTLLHKYDYHNGQKADWGKIGGAIQDRIRTLGE